MLLKSDHSQRQGKPTRITTREEFLVVSNENHTEGKERKEVNIFGRKKISQTG